MFKKSCWKIEIASRNAEGSTQTKEVRVNHKDFIYLQPKWFGLSIESNECYDFWFVLASDGKW